MKILYIAQTFNSESSGVSKKIYSQCNALTQLGNVCKFISIFRNKTKIYSLEDRGSFFESVPLQESLLEKISRWFGLFFSHIPEETMVKISEFNPDIIYVRNISPLLPSYISFLKKIKGKSKIFWEFPTYPYVQEYFMPFKITSFIHIFFNFRAVERLRRIVDKFVVVNEIDDKAAEARLGKYVIIPNGFDASSVPVKKIPELKNEIHMLGLANLAAWHGYDRIITGISEYKGPYKIVFHLVAGSGKAEAEKLKKQAGQLGTSDNVIFYPALSGKELSDLFDTCHIAADNIGAHRKKLTKSSSLKAREYCSRGIPFFTSCVDEDFKNFKFCYAAIDASDEPVDMNKLCGFVEAAYETPNYPQIMRKYAEENLDWKVKILKLFGNCSVAEEGM